MCSKRACALVLYFATTAFVLPAQTLTPLATFKFTDGAGPTYGSLVQGMNGSLYGMTGGGGNVTACRRFSPSGGCGVIFNFAKGAGLTTLYSFDSTGFEPTAGLLLTADGNLYGTTLYGPAQNTFIGYGTIFKITPDGALTTIHTFGGTDGAAPMGGLVKAANGDLYGTTMGGGNTTGCPGGGCGTIFKITPEGVFTTLHSFQGTDGENPYFGLVQATSGDLYGTTGYGGNTTCRYGCGTIFKITPEGVFATLHSFQGTDGEDPYWLIQAADGNLYGTTDYGTIFKLTPEGVLTTIHNFDGADGAAPNGLVQATDGNLYGTTQAGGAGGIACGGFGGCGSIFEINLDGTFTSLYSFGPAVGIRPGAALLQATDGDFYGTTAEGPILSNGSLGDGTVFKFSVGLGPFVKTLPGAGPVGSHVRILGDDLTGATSVTFNGTAAAFSVVSPAQIVATVPAGATTGKVQVITPSVTLVSNVGFVVP